MQKIGQDLKNKVDESSVVRHRIQLSLTMGIGQLGNILNFSCRILDSFTINVKQIVFNVKKKAISEM
jgi:hypothetical protein